MNNIALGFDDNVYHKFPKMIEFENKLPKIEEIKNDLRIDIKPVYKISFEWARTWPRKRYIICAGYCIVTNSGNSYVGGSSNVLKRLGDHIRDRADITDGISYIYIYETERKNLRLLENYLIKRIDPTLNKERLELAKPKKCPICGNFAARIGKIKRKFSSVQRYRCKNCKKDFIDDNDRIYW